MATALSHLRVLDLTSNLSGPYCAMLLADQGADVIKIERPDTGDDMRVTPPFVGDESAPFMIWNRNKRSIILDLKSPDDVSIFMQLATEADVVVENFKPGTAERLCIGYEAVNAVNPRIVYCSISGFGQTGPYGPRGGFDLIAQSMTGLAAVCGPEDGGPHRLPIPINDLCGGMNGAIGILTALAAREQTGQGQHVDVSLFESGIALGVYEAGYHFATGEVPPRLGQKHRGSAPYQIYPTRDGHITVGAAADRFWSVLCGILGCEELIEDPRFAMKADRVANNDALNALLSEIFATETTDHWFERINAAGIPCGPVMDHQQVYTDPQTLAREMVTEIEHPTAGTTKTLGVHIKLHGTPGGVRRPAPRHGEHTEEILRELSARKAAE